MKTVLITGTTSGIGYAFSKEFAKGNYHIILVSRNYKKLKRQQEELQKINKNISIITCDLLRKDAADSIYEEIKNSHWNVDYLINNAGFNEVGPFWETDLKKEEDMIQLHIQFVTRLIKLLLPAMLGRNEGKILNVGSTASYIACPTDAIYAASKAYILFFSNALSSELTGTGVTITTLCPGATKTEFAKKSKIENTILFKLFVMKPEKVAEIGKKAMIQGKRVVVAGVYNKMLVGFSKILPTRIMGAMTKVIMKQ